MASHDNWHPRSGFDAVDGYVWLPRLLEKARRAQRDGLGVYILYEDSPLDAMALRQWGMTGKQLDLWIAEGLDDEAIAARIGALKGSDLAGRKAWSRRFLIQRGLFLRAIDADEGRLPPGIEASALKAILRVVFTIVKGRNRLRSKGA